MFSSFKSHGYNENHKKRVKDFTSQPSMAENPLGFIFLFFFFSRPSLSLYISVSLSKSLHHSLSLTVGLSLGSVHMRREGRTR
jgi:hypothetical protein